MEQKNRKKKHIFITPNSLAGITKPAERTQPAERKHPIFASGRLLLQSDRDAYHEQLSEREDICISDYEELEELLEHPVSSEEEAVIREKMKKLYDDYEQIVFDTVEKGYSSVPHCYRPTLY